MSDTVAAFVAQPFRAASVSEICDFSLPRVIVIWPLVYATEHEFDPLYVPVIVIVVRLTCAVPAALDEHPDDEAHRRSDDRRHLHVVRPRSRRLSGNLRDLEVALRVETGTGGGSCMNTIRRQRFPWIVYAVATASHSPMIASMADGTRSRHGPQTCRRSGQGCGRRGASPRQPPRAAAEPNKTCPRIEWRQ